jgi:hypothetical protein
MAAPADWTPHACRRAEHVRTQHRAAAVLNLLMCMFAHLEDAPAAPGCCGDTDTRAAQRRHIYIFTYKFMWYVIHGYYMCLYYTRAAQAGVRDAQSTCQGAHSAAGRESCCNGCRARPTRLLAQERRERTTSHLLRAAPGPRRPFGRAGQREAAREVGRPVELRLEGRPAGLRGEGQALHGLHCSQHRMRPSPRLTRSAACFVPVSGSLPPRVMLGRSLAAVPHWAPATSGIQRGIIRAPRARLDASTTSGPSPRHSQPPHVATFPGTCFAH